MPHLQRNEIPHRQRTATCSLSYDEQKMTIKLLLQKQTAKTLDTTIQWQQSTTDRAVKEISWQGSISMEQQNRLVIVLHNPNAEAENVCEGWVTRSDYALFYGKQELKLVLRLLDRTAEDLNAGTTIPWRSVETNGVRRANASCTRFEVLTLNQETRELALTVYNSHIPRRDDQSAII